MRITNAMMANSFMSNLNSNMEAVNKYQNQLSSGLKLQNLSDDPIGVITALSAKSKLNKLDIHNSAITAAGSWLKQTESSLNEVNSALEAVYEKTVQASNGPLSADDEKTIGIFVEQMRQQIVQAGNTSFGGRYIFGGYNTTTEPFTTQPNGTVLYDGVDLATAPAAVTGPLQAQVIQYATGTNITTDVSINGVDLMGTGANNINKILNDLETALNTGADAATIRPFVDQLTNKKQDILTLLADVGGKMNRLDMMTDANGNDEANYTEVYSNTVDADVAEATMNFKTAQAVYQSALQVGGMILQPTLMDFLK